MVQIARDSKIEVATYTKTFKVGYFVRGPETSLDDYKGSQYMGGLRPPKITTRVPITWVA